MTFIQKYFCSVALVFLSYFSLLPNCIVAQGSGNAIQLDGYDDFALFSNHNRGITNQLTVEAWVKTNSMGHHHIVSKYDRDSENGFQLLIQNGKACLAGRDGSGNYRLSGYSDAIVADNNWHHLAGVVQDGIWTIYVDGILQNQQETGYTNVVLNNNEDLLLGNYYYAYLGNHFYRGLMDEVRIWKKALTQEEIRHNMCMTLPSDAPGLVAYFKLDNIANGVIIDHSPLKMNGRLMHTVPAFASKISGAPIGDISTYRYTPDWDKEGLQLEGSDGSKFRVDSIGSGVAGIHIYYVQGRPNSTTGMQQAGKVESYYGFFTPLLPDKKHKISYISASPFCTGQLYEREENADLSWEQNPSIVSDKLLTAKTTGSRGEYAAVFQTSGKIEIKGTPYFCTGSSTALSINTTMPVRWNTGETTASINVNQGGKYWVTVTQNGCILTDTISVEKIPLPLVELGVDAAICPGQSLKLEAPIGYTYLWNSGATTSSIEVSLPGNYWVEVRNSNGCITRDEITVKLSSQPEITFPEEIVACYGERVTLDATTTSASYLWSNGQITSSIEATSPAEYSVAITVDGCIYTKHIKVVSDECPTIPNIITPNGDGKNDAFVVLGVEQNTLELKVFNRWGKLVYIAERYDNGWEAAEVPAGAYYYYLTSSRTQKLYKGWLEVMK